MVLFDQPNYELGMHRIHQSSNSFSDYVIMHQQVLRAEHVMKNAYGATLITRSSDSKHLLSRLHGVTYDQMTDENKLRASFTVHYANSS